MSSIIESLWEHFSYLPLKKRLKEQPISLKKWPNFGFSEYKPEFITIAAILSKQKLTSQQIIKITGYEAYMVHSFLNAAYLLNLIDTQLKPNQDHLTINDKFNAFTHRMKHFFDFEA